MQDICQRPQLGEAKVVKQIPVSWSDSPKTVSYNQIQSILFLDTHMDSPCAV